MYLDSQVRALYGEVSLSLSLPPLLAFYSGCIYKLVRVQTNFSVQ